MQQAQGDPVIEERTHPASDRRNEFKERRRPGRIENISPELIALLRNPAGAAPTAMRAIVRRAAAQNAAAEMPFADRFTMYLAWGVGLLGLWWTTAWH